MTISTRDPPSANAAALRKAMSSLLPRAAVAGPLAGPTVLGGEGPAGTAVAPSRPLEVFSLQLDAIVSSEFLAKARPIGWRYLITAGDREIAQADIRGGGTAEFANMTRGELVTSLSRAAHLAESTYDAAVHVYQARILEIPALYVVALWLLGDHRDRFIWIADGARAGQNVVAEDPSFLDTIRARAAAARAMPRAIP